MKRVLVPIAIGAAVVIAVGVGFFGAGTRDAGVAPPAAPDGPRGANVADGTGTAAPTQPAEFVGSVGCADCHSDFYAKWSTSMHGLAMRPFTPAFAREHLSPQPEPIRIGDRTYQALLGDDGGFIVERGPEGETRHRMAHAMGGKNVFYFLTPWQRGRLQVLPVAYDVRRKEWYDTAGSMVRHFGDVRDEALDWRERPFTFNTACYTCHVSQLAKNYSVETDTYRTTWREPGINCEACHGPGGAHVEAMVAADGRKTDDLKIIVTRPFSTAQMNSLCGPCHAKMSPITAAFVPGEDYFDHYNLATLEDRDFYPDGRDLGENFTYTLWRISPCAASGRLDCMHCHTSSGRNRHVGAQADQACMPCHEQHVRDPAAHSHHPPDSEASRCVACHMPRTEFARMRRHDHTMLPPTPAATIAFGSPNACNLCHTDRDARWSDEWVRRWYPRDYQAPLMERASLIDAARKGHWSRLPDILRYIGDPGRNEVFANSLIRLLAPCRDPDKWPTILGAIRDPSPLIRSSAATALADNPDAAARDALVRATGDPVRLVRVSAAAALARHRLDRLEEAARRQVERATAEYLESLLAAPDDPRSHYNLGVYHQDRGDLPRAIECYRTALRLDPVHVPTLVNLSMVYANTGQTDQVEELLRQALRAEPENAAANFNLGLLLAERERLDEAEDRLRRALRADPSFAQAAYNLALLVGRRDLEEALTLARRAAELAPDEPRYAYLLGLYLHRKGDSEAAIKVLAAAISAHPGYADAYLLLAAVYEQTGRPGEARNVYAEALNAADLPPGARQEIEARLAALNGR